MTYADAAERYELTTRIATGGMGEVWRGVDQVLGRDVAIKIPKAEYADNEDFRARFADEARNAAALNHPNVASVFDFGEAADEGGSLRPFLVMELVEGRQLSELIATQGPFAPEVAADLIAQTAAGVGAAHDAGIVHRDLKPSNLMVTEAGQVKITDFGIARAGDGVALTQTGQLIGTPHYISPEQADGRSATKASDVYSLGVVLFECLTGQRPFAGDSPVATALAHIRQPVPPLPEHVPEWIAAVVARCLAKDPDERYADAAALAAALRGAEPTQVITLPPIAAGSPLAAPIAAVGRRRWLLPGAAAFAVLLLAGSLLLSGGDDPEANSTPPSTSPTSTAPSLPARISLEKKDYVGDRLADVIAELESLDLVVDPHRVRNPGDQDPRTVMDLHPPAGQTLTGLVAGDTVVVDYYGPLPPPDDGGDGGDDGDGKSGQGKGKGKGPKR